MSKVSLSIDQFIAANGGNARDALNVALARLEMQENLNICNSFHLNSEQVPGSWTKIEGPETLPEPLASIWIIFEDTDWPGNYCRTDGHMDNNGEWWSNDQYFFEPGTKFIAWHPMYVPEIPKLD